ncbi:mercury methylation ferredoxin HgcB [Chloroflexota bacterium]
MLRYLENVVTLQLDAEACNGCTMCAIVCPHGVFDIKEGKAVIIDRNACIECGACAINCPVNAIQVQTGAGCASGILLGAIGKGCECSNSCGVSPEGKEPGQSSCCETRVENTKTDSSTGCCNS